MQKEWATLIGIIARLYMYFFQRCQCEGCVAMTTGRESVCCSEIERILAKKMSNIFSA